MRVRGAAEMAGGLGEILPSIVAGDRRALFRAALFAARFNRERELVKTGKSAKLASSAIKRKLNVRASAPLKAERLRMLKWAL